MMLDFVSRCGKRIRHLNGLDDFVAGLEEAGRGGAAEDGVGISRDDGSAVVVEGVGVDDVEVLGTDEACCVEEVGVGEVGGLENGVDAWHDT